MQSVSGWQADAESLPNFLQAAEILELAQVTVRKLARPQRDIVSCAHPLINMYLS